MKSVNSFETIKAIFYIAEKTFQFIGVLALLYYLIVASKGKVIKEILPFNETPAPSSHSTAQVPISTPTRNNSFLQSQPDSQPSKVTPPLGFSCFSASFIFPYGNTRSSVKIYLSNFYPTKECFEKAYQIMIDTQKKYNIDGKPHFWCSQDDNSIHIILGAEHVPAGWEGYPVYYPDCGEYTKIMKELAEYIWGKEAAR